MLMVYNQAVKAHHMVVLCSVANPKNKKNGENRPITADSPLIHELMQVFFTV